MPCLMSPKSNIQVQLKPMENHSTGMLMNVMEIPRARIILREHRRPPCYTILLSINKTPACISEEHSDERAGATTPGEPFRTQANVLLDGAGRLNLGLFLGSVLHLNVSGRSRDVSKGGVIRPGDEIRARAGHQLATSSVSLRWRT